MSAALRITDPGYEGNLYGGWIVRTWREGTVGDPIIVTRLFCPKCDTQRPPEGQKHRGLPTPCPSCAFDPNTGLRT